MRKRSPIERHLDSHVRADGFDFSHLADEIGRHQTHRQSLFRGPQFLTTKAIFAGLILSVFLLRRLACLIMAWPCALDAVTDFARASVLCPVVCVLALFSSADGQRAILAVFACNTRANIQPCVLVAGHAFLSYS